jgi:hypothetical protein
MLERVARQHIMRQYQGQTRSGSTANSHKAVVANAVLQDNEAHVALHDDDDEFDENEKRDISMRSVWNDTPEED